MTHTSQFPAALSTRAEELTRAAADFGHVVSTRPWGVLTPRTVRDVQDVIAFAGPRGRPVSARGGGYSLYGQGQADGGFVLDMGALNRVDCAPGERTLVAEAGALWRDVVRAALTEGLTPPVLTDHLGSSVGGVLSTGGIGTSSHHHGLVSDAVASLDVVTGTGELVTCSPDLHPGLFDAVLAGLGQCALIVRATLRLTPAPERVRRYRLYHQSPESFFADQHRLVRDRRFSHLDGQVRPALHHTWHYMIEAVVPHRTGHLPLDDDLLIGDLGHVSDTVEIEDVSYGAHLHRLDRAERILRVTGEWQRPHPWLTLLLPARTAPAFVAEVLADSAQNDLRTNGVVQLHPLLGGRLHTPLLRRPPGELLHVFSLMRTAPPANPSAVRRSVAANRAAYERARELGGVVHPVSALPMTCEDWRRHFGDTWDVLARAKDRHDPYRILTRGPGLWP
ncbi:FAD-binding protein [Streptomyces sp. NPDC005485]|uniref:FAD-binding protein n=1 Tax=Streptomyces sp. NPDC005485 TaxID=3155591 RepID=UPI0033B639CC